MLTTDEIKKKYSKITVGEIQELTKFLFLDRIFINEKNGDVEIKGLNRELSMSEKVFIKEWWTFFKEGEGGLLYENLLSYFSWLLLKIPEDEMFAKDPIDDKIYIRYNILSLYAFYYPNKRILPNNHQNLIFLSLLNYLEIVFQEKIEKDVFFRQIIESLPKLLKIETNDVLFSKYYPYSLDVYFSFIKFTKERNIHKIFTKKYLPLLKDLYNQLEEIIKKQKLSQENIFLQENVKIYFQILKDMLEDVEGEYLLNNKKTKIDFFIKNKENILENIKKNVIGQDKIIDDIFPNIGKVVLGINKRPTTYLFLGNSGVGKTKLSEEIAFSLGSEACIINLGNVFDKYSLASILGSPPGYIGFGQETIIEKYISKMSKKRPDGFIPIIVFDEIEKADPAIYNLWLELFDRGTITLQSGNVINLSQSIIILTSNLGADSSEKIGFSINENKKEQRKAFENEIMNKLKKFLRPEIINRIDKAVIFNDLSKNDLKKIKKNIILKSVDEYIKKNDALIAYIKSLNLDVEDISNKIYEKLKNIKFNDIKNIRNFEKTVESKIYQLLTSLIPK